MPPAKVVLEQTLPLQTHRKRNLGKAIAWKIHQGSAVFHPEQVDQLRPAGRLGNKSQPGVPDQRIDCTRFPGIRPADERDLRSIGDGKPIGLGDGYFKCGMTEDGHGFDTGNAPPSLANVEKSVELG